MSIYFEQIKEPLLMQSYAILFFVTFILCIVIILSSDYGFSRRGATDEIAVQSAHTGFVPRVGGVAIYIAVNTNFILALPLSVALTLHNN